MLRVATVYTLVLTTVAGPWLCCCTVERVVRATQQLVRLAGKQGSDRKAHACCGGHGSQGRPHHSSPQNPGNPSRPAPGPCPCKAEMPSVEFSLPPETSSPLISGDVADWLRLPFPFPGSLDLTVPLCPDEFTKSRGAFLASSSGGARALLSALHVLRC